MKGIHPHRNTVDFTRQIACRHTRRLRQVALYVVHAVILTAGVTACGSDVGRTIDPLATYDAYGSPFEPAGALPVQAVVAEPDLYMERGLIMEGMAMGACDAPGCLTIVDAGDDDQVHIHVERGDDDGYAFDVPPEVTGRRIVAAGVLRRGPAADAGESLTPADNDSTYDLFATGLLVEKVRN